ncbi:MAG: DMT family transporter [Lentisphaeria bacterium]|nr:DMT family transporter [Lentisphaeria bacterium]
MREYQGYLLALLTTMLWGSSFVAARSLLAGTPQTDPLFMVFCRFGIGALTLFLLAFLLKKDVRIKSRRHAWQIFRAASLIYWGMSLLLFMGQKTTSATTGALILESGPAVLTILWKLFSRQKTTVTECFGCLFCFFGSMLVLKIITPEGFNFSGDWSGQILLLASAVCWVAGSVYTSELMKNSDKLATTAWLCLTAALLTLPVMGIFHETLLIPRTLPAWGTLLYFGIFPTAIAFLCWNAAMLILPLWKLNLMQNLTPLFTLAGAYFLLGEKLSPLGLAGTFIVLGSLSSIILFTAKRQRSI